MSGIDKLNDINRKVKIKQNMRFGGMCVSAIVLALTAKEYFTHKGVTEYQMHLSRVFPEEYKSIAKKIIESLE